MNETDKNKFNPQTPQPPPSPQHNSYPGFLLPQVNTTITLNECKMINTATQTTGSTTDSMTGQATTTGSPGQATTTQSPTVEGEKWTSKGRGYTPTSVTCWFHCHISINLHQSSPISTNRHQSASINDNVLMSFSIKMKVC